MTTCEHLAKRYSMAPFFGEQVSINFTEDETTQGIVINVICYIADPATGEEIPLQVNNIVTPMQLADAQGALALDATVYEMLRRLAMHHLDQCFRVDQNHEITPEVEKLWDIWSAGTSPTYWGASHGVDFEAACISFAHRCDEFNVNFNPQRMQYKRRHLWDNETDARTG